MSKRITHNRADRLDTDNEAGHTNVADCPDFADDDHRAGGIAGDPWNESAMLMGLQEYIGHVPGVVPTARALSFFGEHALGWMGIAVVGALVDSQKRNQWLSVGVGAVAAHAVTVVTKRVVRRPRPHAPGINILVGTPSRLSFPSSHATSTTAALRLISSTIGSPAPLLGVPVMMTSRMVLGVHYPTDVLSGATVGWVTAGITRRLAKKYSH